MSTVSDQSSTLPASRFAASSVICNIQVPAKGRPLKLLNSPSGWKDPVNGAVAAVIGRAASSSKTVLTKSSPAPPTPLNNSTAVPSGPTKTTFKSDTCKWSMSSFTFKSEIRPRVEISIGNDSVWPLTSCVPVADNSPGPSIAR